jgi:Dockerin type I domain
MNTPKAILIVRIVLLLSSVGYTATSALSDPLQEYAQQCDAAIGITVPDFNCDSGTLVPTTHFANGLCDRPNVLESECDPGSRFQVLPSNNADAYAVAHCRKQGNSAGRYRDIAVIQHNQKNGATCFYQALDDLDGTDVKAPSKGTSAWPWLTPARTAAIGCGACHDNGPIIRSPYLSQVIDRNGNKLLPGAGDPLFNRDQPYFFVGNDFASWKAYKVEIDGNTCNGCHRMGVNNIRSGLGTALDFGIRATAESQEAKNPHSPDSPIWMLPGQIFYNSGSDAAAHEIRECALRFNESPLPNSPSCSITLYTGAIGEIGDIDGDGDVDRDDLEVLFQDHGKSVSQSACGVRCDLNGDGQISNLDAHELILLCSRPQCATE